MVGNGGPILVLRHERYTWIVDFSFSHLVFPVLYVDPPLSALWPAQVPLITSVNSFRLGRLETAPHRVEHLLRCRVYVFRRPRANRAHTNRHGKRLDHQWEAT